MSWICVLAKGPLKTPGMVGTEAARAENVANAGLCSALGHQPSFGASESGLDPGGGAPVGGFAPSPSTDRSGLAGRGRNQALSCMSSAELNACYAPGPQSPAPGDPRGFCWHCPPM
jgi:hypothetical protein